MLIIIGVCLILWVLWEIKRAPLYPDDFEDEIILKQNESKENRS